MTLVRAARNPRLGLQLLAGSRHSRCRRSSSSSGRPTCSTAIFVDLVRLVGKVPRRPAGRHRLRREVQRRHQRDRRRQPSGRRIEPTLDRHLRQPVGQDLSSPRTIRCGPTSGRSSFTPTTRRGRCRLTSAAKVYGMVYVGNNWFRWQGPAPCPARPSNRSATSRPPRARRPRLGRAGAVGQSDAVRRRLLYRPSVPEQLGVEVLPPVRFDEVIAFMGSGVVSPGDSTPAVRPAAARHLPDVRNPGGEHDSAVCPGRQAS